MRHTGRLSTLFSSDSEDNRLNETAFFPNREKIEEVKQNIPKTSRTQKKNMFQKKTEQKCLVFDLRRILICLYILSKSTTETKSKFIADLYPILRTEIEVTEIF